MKTLFFLNQSKKLSFIEAWLDVKRLIVCFVFITLFSASSYAQLIDSYGDEFWIAFPANYQVDESNTSLQLFIAAKETSQVLIEIEEISFSLDTIVPANELITVSIPLDGMLFLDNTVQSKGIHVVSDNEVIIYGLNQREFSTDAYLALPVDALGTEHYIMSYVSVGSEGRSQFALAASEDNTVITITSPVSLGANPADVPFTVTLNEGESIQYRSGIGQDVTGTKVSSTAPISVFGSNLCANVPETISYCDHLVEMMPSIDKWGQDFVTTPFAERENGDVYRIMAAQANTVVNVGGAITTLTSAGDFYEFNLTEATSITSDKAILVAQFMQGNLADNTNFVGDPSMTILTPTEQFLGDYTVSTPAEGFISHHLNLVVQTSQISSIVLDGAGIDLNLFSAVSGTAYSVAQVPVEQGIHAISGQGAFGVAIYGANADDSYAYSGGQVYSAIAEVNSLTLGPDMSTDQLGNEQCVTAVLTDADGDPISGTRVDFEVTGVNTTSGFIFTNAAGEAVFCYSGVNVGEDLVVASQGVLEADAIVNWEDYDCPNLEANAGDACDDMNADTENDMVTDNCECVGTPIVVDVDCPNLEANIGDACDDMNADTENDMVTDNCECVGTPIVVEVDCPNLEANIGDACDDMNADTENDMVTDNCECVGTPIVVEFDCPQFEANIGDACELADGETGTLNENCECTPTPTCQNFMYYIADHDAADGISDIYGVTLSGGVATMTYIATSEIEVHIAFNEENNNLYLMSKHENSYRTLDPSTGVFGPTVMLGADYGEITAAVFNAEGKMLFGSQNNNAIYCVNVLTNVVSDYDTYAPVTGGDLAFDSAGMLYLTTRSGGGGMYEVYPDDVMPDVLIGSVPNLVTGMAITADDQLLVSSQGMMSLDLYNTDGSSAMTSYMLDLDGEPYTLRDGDMASGCNTRDIVSDCDNYATFYVNHGPDIDGSDLYTIDFVGGNAQLNYVTNVDFEAHIGYNPEDGLIYFVNKDGSNVRIYDLVADMFVGDLPILGGVDELTAVLYDSNDGELYVGDANSDIISSIDLVSGIASYYANAPVFGGDIAILNGTMYLARRNLNQLFRVVPFGDAVLLGDIPGGVNGMAPSPNDGNLVTSSASQNAFVEISAVDGSTVSTFPATLDGDPFTFINGDMASGCIDNLPDVSFISIEAESQLTAYPNPTSGQTQVVFVSAVTGKTLVEVYDMNGRNVKTLFNQEAQKDQEYRLNFDGTYLPNGVYMYRLTNNTETIVEKFMIAR